MAVQFIVGRAGAGKSHYLYEKLIEKSLKYRNKNFIAIVPEQFSMETQKQILTMHPNRGSFNIEVTSMTRLAYTVFEEQGFNEYKVMDDLGKTLIMRKVMEQCKDKLTIYKSKTSMPGFAEKMKTIVSEFKQYGITDDVLNNMKAECDSKPLLRHKLNDVEIISDAFNEYIKEKVITTEDVLTIFCKYISSSDFIKNTYFYIDGFTGFTPIQYQVLELLIKYCAGVKIAITLPEDDFQSLRNAYSKGNNAISKYELFNLSKDTLWKLKDIINRNNIEQQETVIVGEGQAPYRIRDNKELTFLEKNLFRNNSSKYRENCKALEVHSMSNPREEATYVAGRISELIVDKGYRYNDIAVITGDMDGYYRYIEEEFSKNNIPAFIDHKHNIASNPFVDGIKAAIEIVEKDFSYETVFHLIRLGFLPIDREAVDIMENYVLQSGRRGFKSYGRLWEKAYKGMTAEELDMVNQAREKLVEIIRPLREELKKKKATVREYTKAVYQFVQANNMQRQIDDYRIEFQNQGEISRAKEYEQVYVTIITLLDRIVELMGDEVLTIKEYKQILQAGFESVKVGIIPPGLDTVMVGDIERTRLKDTKRIIFFMGVNDGIIPKAGQAGGIITDTDREFLEKNNYILAPTATDNVFKQKFYLYTIFAKPTEKMFITFSKSGSDGATRRKSYIISTLMNLFENLKVIDEDESEITLNQVTTRSKALDYLSQNIYEYSKEGDSGIFKELMATVMKNKEYSKVINLMFDGAFYSAKNPILDENVARQLYGNKENIGITRLERFAACAFAHFLQYGMKLTERVEYEFKPMDMGNVMHEALESFAEEVRKRGMKWTELTEQERNEIADRCLDNIVADYGNTVLKSSARNEYMIERTRRILRRTVWALQKQLEQGEFQPEGFEVTFGGGRIDRVDIMEDQNKVYVKVIDYKTGNTSFDLVYLYHGLQLQLMIYLDGALRVEQKKYPDKEIIPAGVFYYNIKDPMIQEKIDADVEAVSAGLMKELKMNGLVQADPELVYRMDSSLGSIPVAFNKDGSFRKNSSVADRTQFAVLGRYVRTKIEKIRSSILEGDAVFSPYELGKKNACTYCPYMTVCGFDRRLSGYEFRRLKNFSDEELWKAFDREAE